MRILYKFGYRIIMVRHNDKEIIIKIVVINNKEDITEDTINKIKVIDKVEGDNIIKNKIEIQEVHSK